jgi:DNA-binding response OmpR family regulator
MVTGGKMKSSWEAAKKWFTSIRKKLDQAGKEGKPAALEAAALVIGKPPENLQVHLQEIGFASITASNANEAAQATSELPIEIILLVVQGESLDYCQILESIEENKNLVSLPVVAVTTPDHLESLISCLGNGVDDYYFLPLNTTLFKIRLNNILALKQISQSHDQLNLRIQEERERMDDLMNAVVPIGVSMTGESNTSRLLETILVQAMKICNADAGTIYMRAEDDTLKFELLHNQSLDLKLGGSTGKPIDLPFIPLYDPQSGQPDTHHVVTRVAHTAQLINIPNLDADPDSSFSGPHKFDQKFGYKSVSFLAVPLKNAANEVSGVLQLINAKDGITKKTIEFDPALEEVVLSLASLAAVSLDARERESSLRQQITQLQIQIDRTRAYRQVAEITETDYFQNLQSRVASLRSKRKATR